MKVAEVGIKNHMPLEKHENGMWVGLGKHWSEDEKYEALELERQMEEKLLEDSDYEYYYRKEESWT